MSFGDKRTQEFQVEEGTVHTAPWLNGTGTTESPLVPRLELTRFPLWENKTCGQTLFWWTERKRARREKSWKEDKNQRQMDGSYSHCGTHVYLRFHFFNFVLFLVCLFELCATWFLCALIGYDSLSLDIEVCFPSAETRNIIAFQLRVAKEKSLKGVHFVERVCSVKLNLNNLLNIRHHFDASEC